MIFIWLFRLYEFDWCQSKSGQYLSQANDQNQIQSVVYTDCFPC